MRVEIILSKEVKEPYAQIHAGSITEEVQRAADFFRSGSGVITVRENEKIVVLDAQDIYMVRMENKETAVYGERKRYVSGKKLYEMENMLGDGFMRISKTTIVNLKKIDSLEPSFNAMMYVVMKNGCRDYITRTYLKQFKKYLGI